MDTVLNIATFCILNGFLVPIGTGMLLGIKKARSMPGGSLGAGIAGAFIYEQYSIVFIVFGAICGLIGWLIYFLLTRSR